MLITTLNVYFGCCSSRMHSGSPHDYVYKKYGPRKAISQYVSTRDSVGVAMDMVNAELSFVLNGGGYWCCVWRNSFW